MRGIARETETAGLPGLRRSSVIPCVSHPVPGASTQVVHLRKRVYIHTHLRKKKILAARTEGKKNLIHPLSHFLRGFMSVSQRFHCSTFSTAGWDPSGCCPWRRRPGVCVCALQEGNDGIISMVSSGSLMIANDVKWPWSKQQVFVASLNLISRGWLWKWNEWTNVPPG